MEMHYFLLILFIGYFTLVPFSSADDYGIGECPKVDPIPDFDFKKFSGLWYVAEKFDTSSSCWTYYFINHNGTLKVIQSHNQAINKHNPEQTPGTVGILEANATEPGFMSVKFSDNIIGKAEFIVYFTDYENYGAIFRCQKFLFGHRQSATILSRRPNLRASERNRARAKLIGFNIDVSSFKTIDQSNCANTPTIQQEGLLNNATNIMTDFF